MNKAATWCALVLLASRKSTLICTVCCARKLFRSLYDEIANVCLCHVDKCIRREESKSDSKREEFLFCLLRR